MDEFLRWTNWPSSEEDTSNNWRMLTVICDRQGMCDDDPIWASVMSTVCGSSFGNTERTNFQLSLSVMTMLLSVLSDVVLII